MFNRVRVSTLPLHKLNTYPRAFMDISRVIEAMKKEPGFSKNVGMVLVHNGVVFGGKVRTCLIKNCLYKDTILTKVKEKAGVEVIEGSHSYMPPAIFGS